MGVNLKWPVYRVNGPLQSDRARYDYAASPNSGERSSSSGMSD